MTSTTIKIIALFTVLMVSALSGCLNEPLTSKVDSPIMESVIFNEIERFLINDTTNEHEYIYGKYMCTDFSEALFVNMSTAGFKPQYVLAIAKSDNPTVNHMMIKCNNYIIEPSNDEIMITDEFVITEFGKGYHIIYLNEFYKSCLDKWWAFIEDKNYDTIQNNNPTFEEIENFLVNDITNEHEYIHGEYTCSDFSKDLITNMSAGGFQPQYVWIIPKIYSPISHMAVRCGNYIIEPSNDVIIPVDEFTLNANEKGLRIVYLDVNHNPIKIENSNDQS